AAKNSARAEHSPTGTDPFEGHGDVGNVLHAGSVEYDAAKRSYTIAGSGENMWFASDAFQFVWTKVSGDATLTADISFLGKGVNEHRKAVLMIRQSLDADSPYADAALHGSGLTSLQYRRSTVRAKSLPWPPRTGAPFTLQRSGLRRPTGCRMAPACSSTGTGTSKRFPWRAGPRRPSTQDSRHVATTTTAFRRTAHN